MRKGSVETTPLAWTSLAFGLMGIVVLIVALIASRVSSIGNALNQVGLPTWISVGFFLVVGALAVIFGIAAIFAITRNRRRGWVPTILGIVLGLFDVLLGLVALALANLQLNIGPFS